jgi:RNA polymerase sigma-70 factor (ECF subfamily)
VCAVALDATEADAMSDARAPVAALSGALAGDPAATRALVDALAPIVHVRVAGALLRSGTGRRQGRNLRQDIEDFSQEVFVALFSDNAKALRAWDPARGMSLASFVGLIADHQVATILRSGRRNPWTEEPTAADDLDAHAGNADAPDRRVYSREVLVALHERLRAELTPRGMALFQMLIAEERSVDEACAATGMTADAIYAWRSRLAKLIRRIGDEITAQGMSNHGA